MNGNRHFRRRDASEGARAIAWKAPPFSIHVVAILGLLAVFIQSFVVQTHIHIAPGAERPPINVAERPSINVAERPEIVGLVGNVLPSVVPVTLGAHQPAKVPHDKYPANEDPSNCPLCQEFQHAGRFIAPAAALVTPTLFTILPAVVYSETATPLTAATHFWLSRAPPAKSTTL